MDSPNFRVPAWSTFTLPRRGKVVLFQLSFAEMLEGKYALLDRQRRIMRLDAGQELTGADAESSSESESDRDYTLPGGQSEYSTAPRRFHLRPRIPLADITPVPEVIRPADLDALGFERVTWDDPRIFVDVDDRVSAVFLGPPVQRAAWEEAIRQANKIMRISSAHLDRARLASDGIRSGVTYDQGLQRPRSIERAENHNLQNMVVLAALRYSRAIQDITSFQNAALKKIAPDAWSDARLAIDAVVKNDLSLNLPMKLTNEGPHQPTAFSEIEYRFSVPTVPCVEEGDHPSAFRAITAVGNYPYHDGKLILWQHRKVIDFPPGSTFLFPAGFVRYSFTEVEKPGWQMLITQSCSAGLHGFVANGFDDRYAPENTFATRALAASARMHKAKEAVALYPTVAQFDVYQAE
ncbi:hypothetical protein B0H11DRAFT_2226349 [Mycena galericulata]|nr:hypothetical protein B0H11DRAFT_2226349 [Mycena galericulata]